MIKKSYIVLKHAFGLSAIAIAVLGSVNASDGDVKGATSKLAVAVIALLLFASAEYIERQLAQSKSEELFDQLVETRKELKQLGSKIGNLWEVSSIRSYEELAAKVKGCESVVIGSLSKALPHEGGQDWPEAKMGLIKESGTRFVYYCATQDEARTGFLEKTLNDLADSATLPELPSGGRLSADGGVINVTTLKTTIHVIARSTHLGDFCNIVILDNRELYLVLPQHYANPSRWLRTVDSTAIREFLTYLGRFEVISNGWIADAGHAKAEPVIDDFYWQ